MVKYSYAKRNLERERLLNIDPIMNRRKHELIFKSSRKKYLSE